MSNYDFKVYEPMKVAKAPDNYLELLSSSTKIIGSTKKDGYYYALIKYDNKVYLFSRSVSKVTGFYSEKIANVPHLEKWAMNNLPNDTYIIGEIYYPGGTSKDVTKIMGCLADKAIERQQGEYGKIHYYIHDILRYNGYDYVINQTPYDKRYSDICKYIDIQANHIPEVEIALCYDNTYLDLANILTKQLNNGEEGMVFRTEEGLYLPGKRRPNIMFKVKEQVDSIDLVISALLDPEKIYTGKEMDTWPYWETVSGQLCLKKEVDVDKLKVPVTKAYFNGWKNALELSAYDNNGQLIKVGQVASGLTDEMREDLALHPELYLNKVCSIQAMSVDPQELSIRHPRFVIMRYDKMSEECKISEIF